MVKNVEELSPEVHSNTLAYRNVLDQGEIRVHKTGPIKRRTVGIPELTRRSINKTTRIKPLRQSRVATLTAANLVGTI